MFNKYLKIITIIILISGQLMLVSCKSLLNENFKTINCSKFTVIFSDHSLEKKLFFSDLKRSLESKLTLITKKEITPNFIEKCELYISIDNSKFSSIISNDGDINRENNRININYKLKANNKEISKSLSLFYSNGVSKYKYSNYIKDKKDDKNNIESIAEDIFLDIVKQLK